MIAKIRAIKETAPSLVIVARTDAKAAEGMEAAVRRANLYADAGADAIFPEALTNAAEFKEMASSIKVPLLANMTEFGKRLITRLTNSKCSAAAWLFTR